MDSIYLILTIFFIVISILIAREFYFIVRYFRYDGVKIKRNFWKISFGYMISIVLYILPILIASKSISYESNILIYINVVAILLNVISIFSKGSNTLINEEGILYQGKIYPFENMKYCYIDDMNKLKFKGKNYKDIIKTTSTIEFDINEEDKYEINSLIRGGVRNTNESI